MKPASLWRSTIIYSIWLTRIIIFPIGGTKWDEVVPLFAMEDDVQKRPVFSGTFRHTLDGKHRVTIPARWRQGEQDEVYLMPSSDNKYLYALPPAEFQRVHEKLSSDPRISAADRVQFARYYFSRALHCTIDRQGRLLIADEFLRVAGLNGEVLLVGAFDRFELWHPERWQHASLAEANTFQQVSNLIGV